MHPVLSRVERIAAYLAAWTVAALLLSLSLTRQGIDAADAMVFAMLDWCFEEQDLWRFVQLLDGWRAHPPPWWTIPASTTPTGWERNMRSAHWPNMNTLGDVAIEALRRAKWQVVTPPVLDLPPLYGPTR